MPGATKRIVSITIFCLYIAAVAYLCFAKPEDVPQLPEYWFGLPADKVGHFLMFMPFPILGYLAFEGNGMSVWRKAALIITLMIIGTGISAGTEQVQAMLQYRSAEMNDLKADGLGILCGGLLTAINVILKKWKS